MWFSNAVSTSVALTIVFRKHFDVSQEANYSVFTKFLYYANVGPVDKVDFEMGVHTPRVSQLSLLFRCTEWLCPAQGSSGDFNFPSSGSFGHCFHDFR